MDFRRFWFMWRRYYISTKPRKSCKIINFSLPIPELIKPNMNCDNFKMFTEAKESKTESESAAYYIPTISDLVKSNILPEMVQGFASYDGSLKFLAACAVGNLVSGIPEQNNKVSRDASIVPLFVQLISSSEFNECENIAEDFLELLSDRMDLLKYIIENDFVKPIVSLIRPDAPTSLLRIVAQTINRFCLQPCLRKPLTTVLEIMPSLNTLLDHTDDEILENATIAVELLVNDDTHHFLIGSGVMPKLVSLLGHENEDVKWHALLALSHLSERSVEQQQLVLQYGALSYFPELLSHKDKDICNGASRFFDYQCVREASISNGLLKKIVENLSVADTQTQIAAVSSILHFVNSPNRFTFHVIREGAVPPLYDLLNSNDVRILHDALACLFHIFETNDYYVQLYKNWMIEFDGLKRIRRLQKHEIAPISRLANSIINQ